MSNLDKYLILVNKDNLFDEKTLSQFEMDTVFDSDGKTYIEKKTNAALKALQKHMVSKFGIALYLTSAGRSIATQQKVLEEITREVGPEEAARRVALPGSSEHHTGLALDVKPEIAYPAVFQSIVDKLQIIPERFLYPKQPSTERKKEMYGSLHQELSEFGFILRYTEENREITGIRPEPWHIRYVGKENAKSILASGLSLEEYVATLAQSQSGFGE